MTQQKQVYKCSVCGNMVEVLHAGVGQLVCCGKPMDLQQEKSEDAGAEKHVPVIEKIEGGVRVKIGSVPHPMEKEHYIEWIEIIADGMIQRKYFQPGDAPEAEFIVTADDVIARGYCNVHGLWKSI